MAAQQAAAARVDADATKWAMRVRVAREIIGEGLAAARTPISTVAPDAKP